MLRSTTAPRATLPKGKERLKQVNIGYNSAAPVGAEPTSFVHADGESEGLSDREPSLVEGLGSGGLGSHSASPECCAGNDSLMSGIPK